MRVFVTGATGFIGRQLVNALLAGGDDVVAVSRDAARARLPSSVRVVEGDPSTAGPWMDAVTECDAAINLAGEPILGSGAKARWTEARKRMLKSSRIFTTRNLVEAMARGGARTAVLVSTSAVGIYGSRGDESLDEASASGNDFLAELCRDWELEARRASELYRKRSVQIRVGVVLGTAGGALPKMLPAFRAFVGGPIGSGRQWNSFIHIDDLVALFLFALRDSRVEGAINGTAPMPCTMKQLARAIGHTIHRPSIFKAPARLVKLALGEASSVLLEGQRVVPARALALGFKFRFPNVDAALANLLAA